MFRAQHCVLGRLSSYSLREFGSFRRRLQRVGNLQGKLAPRAALRRRLRSHRRRRRLRSRRRRRRRLQRLDGPEKMSLKRGDV